MIKKILKTIYVVFLGEKKYMVLRVYLLRVWHRMPRYYLYSKNYSKNTNNVPNVIVLGRQKADVFFGYYDLTPFSQDGNRLLSHIYFNKKSSELHLACWDISSSQNLQMRTFAKTETWCWQMGARLQWLPSGSGELVIFNTLVDGYFGSMVMDLCTEKVLKRYNRPVYSVSESAQKALYLNFSRLHRLRPGYGYRNYPDDTQGKLAPNDDGLFVLDLESGETHLVYSLKEISETQALSDYSDAEHYINHILWNPSGDKYLFFHLWQKERIRYSRLMVGGDCFPLRCVCWPLGGNVSHYTWRSDWEILLTVSDAKKEVRYILIDIRTGLQRVLGAGILTTDGHPSFSPRNNNCIVSDTYPDRYRNQLVFMYNSKCDRQEKIANFYSPCKFNGEYRCDLHPRFNCDGSSVCVDSAHAGRRQMIVMPVEGCGGNL